MKARYLTVVALLAACASEQQQPANDDAVLRTAEKEVNERLFAYPDAVKSGQVDSIMLFWMPEVRVFEQFQTVDGAAALRKVGDDFFKSFQVTRIAFAPEETVAYDSGRVVYQFGYFTEDFTPRSGGDTTNVRSNFAARWKKGSDGRWRIDRWYTTPAPKE